MHLFYLIALLPVVMGFVLWILNKEIHWGEWLIGSAAAFVVAVMVHMFAVQGMTADTETWSGQIYTAKQYSAWQEYYEYAVYRTEYYTDTETYTDSKGHTRTRTVTKSRQVFDHWEPATKWHSESFEWKSNIPSSYSIDKNTFDYICKKFNSRRAVPGCRTTMSHNSRMIGGDPNDYVSDNCTGWIEPVTARFRFENRIKAAPTVFSFIKVPTNINVYAYPENKNYRISDRLLGTAKKDFSQLEFDQLNAKLGPSKRVNLIIVGFDSPDRKLGEYQRAKWIGGKKNDLVICYGLGWSKCFGWTERETVKRNIETLFLQNVGNQLLPLLQEEVKRNYLLKDWTKFDYISIQPRTSHIIGYIFLLVISQGLLYTWFHANEARKGRR